MRCSHDLFTIGDHPLECALAADATIFCLEGFLGSEDEDVPQRIVRMTLTDPPEVIMTTTFYAADRPPRLVAVGSGIPAPQ